MLIFLQSYMISMNKRMQSDQLLIPGSEIDTLIDVKRHFGRYSPFPVWEALSIKKLVPLS